MARLISRFDPRISVAILLLTGPILTGWTGLIEDLSPLAWVVLPAWATLAAALIALRRHRTARTWLLLALAIATGFLFIHRPPPVPVGLVKGTVTAIHNHRFTVCQPSGCVQVTTPLESPAPVHVGDDVMVRGTMRLPHPPRNPYDLDERQLARSLGVATFVEHPLWIGIDHRPNRLTHRVALARRLVAHRIHERLPDPRSASIVTALLTGSRTALDGSVRAQFSASGLSHVLAVSGLHIGLLALLVLTFSRSLFRRLPVSEEVRRALSGSFSMIGITCIAVWMGTSPSVSRAALMGIVLFGAFARRRPYSPWVAWWWALAAGTIAAPERLMTAGFSLSFAAVAAILVFLPTLSRLRSRPFLASILVSAVATLGTAPLLAVHMGQVPVSGALTSPLVVPIMAPILVMGAMILVDPGPFSAWVTDLLVTLLQHAALWGSQLPDWTRLVGLHVILWPWLILLILAPAPRRRRVRRATLALVVAAIGIASWPVPASMEYTQLDVGQGDATVIILSGRFSVVIDTGASEFNGRAIERHLRARGQRRIDLLIHSHPHADHTGGSRYLATTMPIERFVDNTRSHRGDTLDLGGLGRLYVLHPPEKNLLPTNEASLVLRLQAESTSFLLTGDAERGAEHAVTTAFGPMLDADIVKVAHHGSRSSSSVPFISRTRPDVAIVSAGRRNRFGHPDEEIVARWRTYADSVHVTAQHGAFQMTAGNQ